MSCVVGHRCGSDLALLWLWSRLAAVAPVRPLAWELLGCGHKKPEKKSWGKRANLSNFEVWHVDLGLIITFYNQPWLAFQDSIGGPWKKSSLRKTVELMSLVSCSSIELAFSPKHVSLVLIPIRKVLGVKEEAELVLGNEETPWLLRNFSGGLVLPFSPAVDDLET